MDSLALLVSLHSSVLRSLSAEMDQHFQGLAVAARVCHKKGRIDKRAKRQLEHLDIAASWARHVTQPRCAALLREIEQQVAGECEGHTCKQEKAASRCPGGKEAKAETGGVELRRPAAIAKPRQAEQRIESQSQPQIAPVEPATPQGMPSEINPPKIEPPGAPVDEEEEPIVFEGMTLAQVMAEADAILGTGGPTGRLQSDRLGQLMDAADKIVEGVDLEDSKELAK